MKTKSALGIAVDPPAGRAGILFALRKKIVANLPAVIQAGSPTRRGTPKNC